MTEQEIREEFQKYYIEQKQYPECENNSDEMYTMTIEHFKYAVVNAAYEAGIKLMKDKADKWDKLEAEVAKYYCNKEGEYDEDEPEEDGDLCDIGEACASAMGWL